MDYSYEKKWPNEMSSSSAVLVDAPPMYKPQAPIKVRHYFVFSLFSAICLCPATGLIALAYSVKSSAKADVQFHDKSRLYSRRALFWNLVSVVIAVLSLVVALIFCYQMMDSMKIYNNQMNSQHRANDINQLLRKITENK